jgi:hypothetical protein
MKQRPPEIQTSYNFVSSFNSSGSLRVRTMSVDDPDYKGYIITDGCAGGSSGSKCFGDVVDDEVFMTEIISLVAGICLVCISGGLCFIFIRVERKR